MAVAQAGGEVGCACGKRLPVPTLRGIRQLEPAVEAQVNSAPVWTRVHGTVFAMGLVLAVLSIALVALSSYRYAQLSGFAVDRSADVIKEYSSQLDNISPAEALDLWRTEVLEEGLGEPHQPPWVMAKTGLEVYTRRIRIGLGSLAVGVIAVILSLYVGRK